MHHPWPSFKRDVPERSRFKRGSEDFSASGIGRKLVRQPILRPVTNNTDLFDAFSYELLKIPQNEPVFQSRAFPDTPHISAGGCWSKLIRFPAEFIDCHRHVDGTHERFVN